MTQTTEPTIHKQFEVDGVLVDEGIYLLLHHVWRRGLKTRSSCEGGGPTPYTDLPYIVFPEVDDAIEFLKHTNHLTDYRYGAGIGLNLVHPMIDLTGAPEGKVTWMKVCTVPIIDAWGES